MEADVVVRVPARSNEHIVALLHSLTTDGARHPHTFIVTRHVFALFMKTRKAPWLVPAIGTVLGVLRESSSDRNHDAQYTNAALRDVPHLLFVREQGP
jgi:hypothetical protein